MPPTERFEWTPYRYARGWHRLPDSWLHSFGLCNYHPYQQEQDIILANGAEDGGVLWHLSWEGGIRGRTLSLIHEAQWRLMSHDIPWAADYIRTEVERRRGKWVEVSPILTVRQRPPDAAL